MRSHRCVEQFWALSLLTLCVFGAVNILFIRHGVVAQAPTLVEMCGNGTDDDGDNDADCADIDCFGSPACLQGDREIICYNNIDDDGDGLIDCVDRDCQGDFFCGACGSTSCRPPTFEEILDLSDLPWLKIAESETPSADALARLGQAISRHDPAFARLLDEQGVQMTASLLGSKKELGATLKTVAEELKKEGQAMRLLVREVISETVLKFSASSVRNQEALLAALKKQDLVQARSLLPPTQRPVSSNLLKLREIADGFPELALLQAEDTRRILSRRAFAGEEPENAKAGLEQSSFLAKRMAAIASQDPEADTRSLLDDIEALQHRRTALAGVIGIVDAQKQLDRATTNLQHPSTQSLLSARGIFAYLRSTVNFQAMEQAYTTAARRMRTGFSRLFSALTFRDVPLRAEAADLLGSNAVEKMTGGNLEEQRSVVLDLVLREEPGLVVLLQKLPAEERFAFEQRMTLLKDAMPFAVSFATLKDLTSQFTVLAEEIQNAARSRRNVFVRGIYALQDFFGRSSD